MIANPLLKYGKLFDLSTQNTLVYRWNFFLRTAFHIMPLLGTIYLWRALFAARGSSIEGYNFHSMVFYFLLTLLFSNLITPSEDEWQIAADIREGQLNALLVKPVNYFAYRLSLFVGNRTVHAAMTLPVMALIFAGLRAYVVLPQHGATWLWTTLALTMAALLQFFLAYAVALLAFWLLEVSTVVFIVFSFEYFLSGQLFPLDLTPAWFRAVSEWLPFSYELFFPVTVFLEKVQGVALVKGLLIQAGWLVIMWSLGRFMWSRGLRHYGAFGG